MATGAMTKNERVTGALRGEELDRVPVSAWWHDFEREWSPKGLAEATLEAYRQYGWDYVKVNPRACYYAEDWGAKYQQAEGRQPTLIEPGVSSHEDLKRIQPLDVKKGAYREQLDALRLIKLELKAEAPFIQTVFSPLAVMSRITGSTKYVQKLMRESSHELMMALHAIAETLAAYSKACLEAGASGIFFATVEWGSADNISPDEYETFCRPFDMTVLKAVQGAPFSVFHVCRDNNLLPMVLDYPVQALHWDVHGQGNPKFRAVLSQTDKAVMGGVRHGEPLVAASPAEVAGQAQRAVAETHGRRFLLAPGCSIEPGTPDTNLRAMVQAARV